MNYALAFLKELRITTARWWNFLFIIFGSWRRTIRSATCRKSGSHITQLPALLYSFFFAPPPTTHQFKKNSIGCWCDPPTVSQPRKQTPFSSFPCWLFRFYKQQQQQPVIPNILTTKLLQDLFCVNNIGSFEFKPESITRVRTDKKSEPSDIKAKTINFFNSFVRFQRSTPKDNI
jgi:hypothetical protein